MENSNRYQKFNHSSSGFIYYKDRLNNNRYIYHNLILYNKIYQFVLLKNGIDVAFGFMIKKKKSH